MKFQLLLLVIVQIICLIPTDAATVQYPVILVHGMMAYPIFVNLDKSKAPNNPCIPAGSQQELYWFNASMFMPANFDCFYKNFKLNYDTMSTLTSDQKGAQMFQKDFGGVNGFRTTDLMPANQSMFKYMYKIVDTLINSSYVPGKNFFGAPYDWRKAPNEMQDYYSMLTKLVESAYTKNNKTKVVLLAHCMGNPVILYWLNKQSQAWKDQYIRMWIDLGGILAGSPMYIQRILSGDEYGTAEFYRTLPSHYFSLPSPMFWGPNEVLVSTPKRNYTVNNFQQLFADAGITNGWKIYQNVKDLIVSLEPPNVEFHTIYGVNVSTKYSFIYPNQTAFPNGQPIVISGNNGNGWIETRTMTAFKKWIGKQKQPITSEESPGASALSMLSDSRVISFILKLVIQKV